MLGFSVGVECREPVFSNLTSVAVLGAPLLICRRILFHAKIVGTDIKIEGAKIEAGKVIATCSHCGARPDIDGTMASAAQPLSDKDIVDMAAYLASLK